MDKNNLDFFLQRFSENAKNILFAAIDIAAKSHSPVVGTEHLLYALLTYQDSNAYRFLEVSNLELNNIKKYVEERINLDLANKSQSPDKIAETITAPVGASEALLDCLVNCLQIGLEFNLRQVSSEILLLSCLSLKNTILNQILIDLNINIDKLRDELEGLISAKNLFREKDGIKASPEKDLSRNQFENSNEEDPKYNKSKTLLDKFGYEMTDPEFLEKLSPIYGREKEINRIATILNRRLKNNPILVGEPGVGKTAIVEGLAAKIVKGDVVHSLQDKKIYCLDLALVVAGTRYRGDFEQRIKSIIDEAMRRKNIILFIDEIHQLIGAGNAEGSMDAANILKPVLARGQLKIIGATTYDEYRKNIEKDAALERRLQQVKIDEPDYQNSLAILKDLQQGFEKFHKVRFEEGAVQRCLDLSIKFNPEKFLPDKAIDLIDEVGSKISLENIKNHKSHQKMSALLRKINELEALIDDFANQHKFSEAANTKVELHKTREELVNLENKYRNQIVSIGTSDVNRIASDIYGIPFNEVASGDIKKLKNLSSDIKKKIIAQDQAVELVTNALIRSRLGLSSDARPIGIFLFVGPSGVGKSYLAKILAEEYFGSKKHLIKIDMSELSAQHSSARLLGAPAGYVGYQEGGELTEKVRKQPHSVVLFDEIEKAHPDVLNLLLQIAEDGYLTDSKSRKIDFTNTIIILTSNVSLPNYQSNGSLIGFNNKSNNTKITPVDSEKLNKQLQKFIRPELLNRFDKIVQFAPLDKKAMNKILELQLNSLFARLNNRDIKVKLSPKTKQKIISRGFDQVMGARPLKRAISEFIEDQISKYLINNYNQAKNVELNFIVKNDHIILKDQ